MSTFRFVCCADVRLDAPIHCLADGARARLSELGRAAFRRVVDLTRGLSAAEWTPRELRHSFASLLSAKGVSISQLVGRKSTQATRRCTGTSCDRC